MTSTESVLAKLRKIGLNAEPGHAVPEIMIFLKDSSEVEYPLAVFLTREHNREDGGWEAVIDERGDQYPLEDGPLGDASAQDVRDWVVSLLVYMAVQYASSVVR